MNKNKILGIMTMLCVIIVSAVPAFAASSSSTQTAQVTVSDTIAIAGTWAGGGNNSTINLGSLPADGLQATFNGGASGEQIFTYSNVAIDVYTKASGDFAGGIPADTITINNFLWSNGTSTPAAFTTGYTGAKVLNNIAKAPKSGSTAYPVNLYLTVPVGTNSGSYSTTVYFSAVKTGAAAPTTP